MNTHLALKNKIKEKRKQMKYTQTEFAQMVGTTKNTISALETGQFAPSAYLAAIMCTVLECKFEDLFYLETEED